MAFCCLFHVHSRHSFDSLLSPKRIIAKARDMRVHALVVTDHNSLQGSIEARNFAAGQVPIVVMGAEYQSEKGDIIGLFLKREIRSRQSYEVVREIRQQGGLVVLPHPYKGHVLDENLLAGIDVVESYNARCSASDNARAAELASQRRLPILGGADAHCVFELASVLNVFDGAPPTSEDEFRKQLLSAPTPRIETKPTAAIWQPYSQIVKSVKTRNPRLFVYQAKRMALTLAAGSRHQ